MNQFRSAQVSPPILPCRPAEASPSTQSSRCRCADILEPSSGSIGTHPAVSQRGARVALRICLVMAGQFFLCWRKDSEADEKSNGTDHSRPREESIRSGWDVPIGRWPHITGREEAGRIGSRAALIQGGRAIMRQGILAGGLAASLMGLVVTSAQAQSTSVRRTTSSPGKYAPIDRTPVVNSTIGGQPPVLQAPTSVQPPVLQAPATARPAQMAPPATVPPRPRVSAAASRTTSTPRRPSAPPRDSLARSASSTSPAPREVTASRGDSPRPPVKRSGDPPAKRKARVAAARKALRDLDRRMAIGRLTNPATQPATATAAASASRHSGTLIASGSARQARPFYNADPAATRVPAVLPTSATRGAGVVRAGGTVVRPSAAIPHANVRGSRAVPYTPATRTGTSPAPSPSAYAGYGGTAATAQPNLGPPTLLPSTPALPSRNP